MNEILDGNERDVKYEFVDLRDGDMGVKYTATSRDEIIEKAERVGISRFQEIDEQGEIHQHYKHGKQWLSTEDAERLAAAVSKQIQSAAEKDDGPDERRASIGIEARHIAFSNAFAVADPANDVLTPEVSRTWAELDAREFRKLIDPARASDAAEFMQANMGSNPDYEKALSERAPDVVAVLEDARTEQEYLSSLKSISKARDAELMGLGAAQAERDADAFDIPQRDRSEPSAAAPEKTSDEALHDIMQRNFHEPAFDRDQIDTMPANEASRFARADQADYARLDAAGKKTAAGVLVENFQNRAYAAEFARLDPDAAQEAIRLDADTKARWAVERNNADLLAVPNNELSPENAREIVQEDIASLRGIAGRDDRVAAAIAMGHNAESQKAYLDELNRQAPEIAKEAVAAFEQVEHRDTELGTPMKSIPGAVMVYNDQPGMRGADILMPDGSRVSFGGKEAIDRFAEENKLVAEDVAVLKALDSRADPYRTPAADERLPAGMKVDDLPAIDPAARERMEKARAREMAGVREAMGLDGADAAQPAPAAKQAPRDEVAALDARMEKAQLEELGWRDREDITDLMRDLEKLASKDWQVAADLWQKYRPDDIDKPVFIDGDDIDEKKPGRGGVRDDGRVVDGSKEEDAARNVTPDALRKRFLQAENKFYFRDDENKLAFEDKGKRLATEHNDPEIARSMVDLAQAKGWSSIKLKGTDEFKREVWLQASLKGMDVQGFKPRDVDLARLEDMRKEMGLDTDRASNTIERGAERSKGRDQREERAEPVDRAAVVDEKEQTLSKRQLAALETIKTVMRARGDSEVAVAMAAEMAAERFQTNRVHVGKIIDHGSAPFENDPKKERSYYVKLQTEAGEKIVWGVDLERAVGAGKAQIGDDVALAYQGNKPVTVNVKEHDKAGNVIGVTEKTTNRNTWDVRRLETLREEVKERLTEAARNADRQPLIKVYDRDAQRTQVRPDIVRNEPSKESERARSGRG